MLQIDIQFANYLPSSPSNNDGKLEIHLPECFSCFLGYSYDLRLYTGNVMTHHIFMHQQLYSHAHRHTHTPSRSELIASQRYNHQT